VSELSLETTVSVGVCLDHQRANAVPLEQLRFCSLICHEYVVWEVGVASWMTVEG